MRNLSSINILKLEATYSLWDDFNAEVRLTFHKKNWHLHNINSLQFKILYSKTILHNSPIFNVLIETRSSSFASLYTSMADLNRSFDTIISIVFKNFRLSKSFTSAWCVCGTDKMDSSNFFPLQITFAWQSSPLLLLQRK